MTENNLAKMNKEPTHTIYNCLGPSFWATRKCHVCQEFFTCWDYQNQNYQITFSKVLKIHQLNLEVVVQLFHKSCCLDCFSYSQEWKKEKSIN